MAELNGAAALGTEARLVPVYFGSADDPDLVRQVEALRGALAGNAEVLEPVPLGVPLPKEADAVVLPQILSDTYKRAAEVRALSLPVLVLTSELGVASMFDLDILGYLRGEKIEVLAPYSLEATLTACRALVAKRQLREGSFLIYRDSAGAGPFQPEIFTKNFWYQQQCAERLHDKFGTKIIVKSFKELGARAKAVPDAKAREDWERFRDTVPLAGVSDRALLSAVKIYRALCDELDEEGSAVAAGINCLNESTFSDTTPCLAWDLLYQDRGLVWGCEGDMVSMVTKFIVHRSLRVPVMMSNMYPFVAGQPALKHEHIPAFPAVDQPDNYVLAAHCGYLGVVPRCFATDWVLRPKALAIVDENATAIDARLPLGDLSLSKVDPTFERLVLIESELTGYAGWEGSDCRNGAVIRVPDGHSVMEGLPACHAILSTGHDLPGFKLISQVFGLELELLGGRLPARDAGSVTV